jgi:predicted nucleic acid-binding protein
VIFVDTGAFYALADRSDPAHKRAVRWYRNQRGTLLTSEFVFAETMSLLTKRLGKSIAVDFGEGIRRSTRVRVEAMTPEMLESAWHLFAGRLDKEWDLIDCLSFTFMEARGISEAFGFDRHFLQRGLRLVPG